MSYNAKFEVHMSDGLNKEGMYVITTNSLHASLKLWNCMHTGYEGFKHEGWVILTVLTCSDYVICKYSIDSLIF